MQIMTIVWVILPVLRGFHDDPVTTSVLAKERQLTQQRPVSPVDKPALNPAKKTLLITTKFIHIIHIE